jgi:ankyrin repeat protein
MIVWYLLHQDNATPLIWAAIGGHASVAKLLLDAKAAIDYSNSVSRSSQQLQYLTF